MNHDTIAAISTASGEAGIGVVRLSGPESLEIAKKITKKEILQDRFMHHCFIYRDNKVIDEALVCYMKSPHTYTGEDVVEIQCHGSFASLHDILLLVFSCGAECAEPGEFTKRAFLNGRLDLSEAEAVIDLIKAKTSRSLSVACSQLTGILSEKIKAIRNNIKELLINITVNMDYPDEDIEQITYENLINSLSYINDELLKLSASSKEGKILREGLRVAIIGKPNVGKSSLMNIFTGENRSIVTDIPGTTRDIIEESAQINGIPVVLIDTAGIHRSDDTVEKIGIEKSKEVFEKADIILLVLDSSVPLSDDDIKLIKASNNSDVIILLNKTDLNSVICCSDLNTDIKIIPTSFKTGYGIDAVKSEIEHIVKGSSFVRNNDPVISNIRHINLVNKALAEISEALDAAKIHEALDLIEINVNAAFSYLGEITGDTASGEIIDEIFSRFCLGK